MSKLISQPLSNFDLEDLLKDINLELNERKRINIYTVDEMVQHPALFKKSLKINKYSIIFIDNPGSKIGHWIIVYLSNKGKRLNIFDSYGSSPKDLSTEFDTFLRNNFKDVRFNTFQYQKYGSNIATCGRWAMGVLSLNKLYNFDLSLEDLNHIFVALKKDNKGSFDKTITDLINSHI